IDPRRADSSRRGLALAWPARWIPPLNDCFVDFDALAGVAQQTFSVPGTSHYSEMVREARRQRRLVDGKVIDWIVVRNRLSIMGSRNRRLIETGLHELAGRLGFRFSDGVAERLVYPEFFPLGLTPLAHLY